MNQGLLQLIQPLSSERTDRDDGRAWTTQKRSPQKLLDLEAHYVERVTIDRIRFGEPRDAALQSEQLQNGEMLAGLRLDEFIPRDHEHDHVNAAHSRQH